MHTDRSWRWYGSGRSINTGLFYRLRTIFIVLANIYPMILRLWTARHSFIRGTPGAVGRSMDGE